ncbi:hypothetical protein [Streptomyces sp. NPDC046853]|uniref:hypothetical protein n=1 Tax=unclassified Streptomyces TaxID=2593676 RepID=UPI0033E0B507
MDPLIAAALIAAGFGLVVAAAAVFVTRHAITGTDSAHRADVLKGVAVVILAIRGKR